MTTRTALKPVEWTSPWVDLPDWSTFGRCGECGVDEGEACRDDDDTPCLVECKGRVCACRSRPTRCERCQRTKRQNRAKYEMRLRARVASPSTGVTR